jgi:glycosyltransferase involved in cell wall biosynthesis
VRIGIFHNRYHHRGGEDSVVEIETELLAKSGHDVRLLTVDNREEIANGLGALRAGLRARRNPRTRARLRRFLADGPLDVAHVHNFFPILSPALHEALHEAGVPVVQTLHNYRLLCANGMLHREGRSCEECLAAGPWHAVRHGCYRGSRLQTAVWAEMTAHHRRRGTWRSCVDLFTTPSRFARDKLLQAGLPAERLRVLPNPLLDPGPPTQAGEGGVYVGRLSREKGVDVLLDAWRRLEDVPLSVVGSGPEQGRLRAQGASLRGVRFLGHVSRDRALRAMAAAAFVVAPSRLYEVFPMTVLEALSVGRAVVAPRHGAFSEAVEPGRTGLLYDPGDAASLAECCRALAADADRTRAMGREARSVFEESFSPQRCLERHEALFREVMRSTTPHGRWRGADRSP